MEGSKLYQLFSDGPSSLCLNKVCFSWPNGTDILDKCTLSIPGPGLWMIVGSNGSGKSTLFRLISGMLQPKSGEIYCNLKPLLMFQNPDHQLLMPSCGSDLSLSLPRELTLLQRHELIQDVLEQVDLADMESRPIHTLSGGQKQRLALAGALASDANLLLLDEPTALLDPDSQKSVLRTVSKLCKRRKNPLTALWITHRLEELAYCDGAARMEKGQVGPWLSGHLLIQRLKPLAGRRV
nr:ABC transporter ATP-binding protein [Prochlorococcus sp. MIT 1307]